MVKYKPSETPYRGGGRYWYIVYKSLDKVRSGKKVWKPHVQRVYISGKLLNWKHGKVEKRNGRVVHGVKFFYLNSRVPYHRRKFTAKRGKTTYEVSGASVGKAEMVVEKVAELPSDARDIRITDKKSEVQPTLMEVY